VSTNEAIEGQVAEHAMEKVRRVPVVADGRAPAAAGMVQPESVALDAAPEAVNGVGDLEAKSPIVIRVVDDLDLPVADARLRIWAMRRADEPGGHYLYRGTEPSGTTDREGRVHLEHWEWVNIDGRTGQVTIFVEHPEFVTYRGDLEISPGEHVLQLERGATVVVTGWIGDPEAVVQDLNLRVDRESNLGADAWHTLPDGRRATNRLPPGPHWIVATHMHPRIGRMSSAAVHFDVGGVGWETLHLELHAPIDFVGQLDAAVPRPVTAGRVQLVLTSGGLGGSRINLFDSYDAAIDADGGFLIEDVRPGAGQIFAQCNGWSSMETFADDPIQVGRRFPDGMSEEDQRSALMRQGPSGYILQRAQVPQSVTPFVLLMHRTSALEVTVVGPDGLPVEGALTSAYPNVRVMGVGSWTFPWRDWTAMTGRDGVARIDDLPADDGVWFDVSAKGLRLSKQDRDDMPYAELSPGEVATTVIKLEPDGD